MTRDELIARLEAEAPSRTLNSDIAAFVGFDGWTSEDWQNVKERHGADVEIPKAPPYTTSLDAAMTLVPWPDERTCIEFIIIDGRITRCELRDTETDYTVRTFDLPHGDGANKPIALCIAALRASIPVPTIEEAARSLHAHLDLAAHGFVGIGDNAINVYTYRSFKGDVPKVWETYWVRWTPNIGRMLPA